MIKIRHVSFINGQMIHEYKETTLDSVTELTMLDKGLWVKVPHIQLVSMGRDMNSVVRTYTGSGWTIHGDCTTMQSNQGIEFIPISIKIEDIQVAEKHICKCDLKGANCWHGCRCGGR